MLYGEKSREALNTHAEKRFHEFNTISAKDKRKIYDQIVDEFNMSTTTIDDLVTFQRDIKEFTNFELFCVMYFMDRECLKKYFTQEEIDHFSKERFDQQKIEFPLKFHKMAQVSDDQWIGSITAKELITLRNEGFINYEENQQRAFRIVKYGNEEIYKPFVNNRAVREIKASMESGTYIPDPITLNMPEGSEFVFERGVIKILSTPNGMLNLLDGYHRVLAMSQIMNFNEEFDLVMELRIVNFLQTKAEQFIYQQDQKTKMKRIVSDSYNPNDIGNIICQRLNDDRQCNIYGMIGRNDSNISLPDLSKAVSYFYCRENIKQSERPGFILKVKNELRDKFNIITEQDEMFMGKYSREMCCIIIYVFSHNISESDYATEIKYLLDNIGDIQLFTQTGIKRMGINKLDALREGR